MENNKVDPVDKDLYKIVGELQGSVGELKGTVKGIEGAVANVTTQVEKVSQKIDNLNVVPYSVYENRIKSSDKRFELIECELGGISKDVTDIKSRLGISENSLTGQIAKFLNNMAVKVIGGSVILLIVIGIYFSYSQQLKQFEQSLQVLTDKTNDIKGE